MSQSQHAFRSQESEYTAPERRYIEEPLVRTRHITKGERLLWIAAGFLFFFLAALIITNQARLYHTSSQIQNLQNSLGNHEKTVQQLESQADSLSSPDRIVRFAEKNLGLKLNINNIKVLP
ncbi:cell division protein FtsL [Sporolactobacillus vineae]|uniref:cell division protein FtsL n=1 Tax=Sporolactobacillus vineae TaxID=444463 RepID=UPI000288C86A|nr:cell division protein FtsL [Sporolactobacillus vineae]